jgi:hypothetical protein
MMQLKIIRIIFKINLLTEPQTVTCGNFEFRGTYFEYYTSIDLRQGHGKCVKNFCQKN